TPGFPVTITSAGSYRLTGNLDLRSLASPENVTAILVNTNNVILDLEGFAIFGPTTCTGSPPAGDLTCAPIGSGNGIRASLISTITIKNGIVNGLGGPGVYCGGGCLITALHVENCGDGGIFAMDGSVIGGNTVRRNRLSGINSILNGGTT